MWAARVINDPADADCAPGGETVTITRVDLSSPPGVFSRITRHSAPASPASSMLWWMKSEVAGLIVASTVMTCTVRESEQKVKARVRRIIQNVTNRVGRIVSSAVGRLECRYRLD